MLVIGLTGGIGSGKTSAADLFAEHGAAVIDTDAIAHGLTAPGGTALPVLGEVFGPGYLSPEGGLDRARMRKLVFSDPIARKKLETVLHPMIREEVRARIRAVTQPYAIVVVPLLLETGAYRELTDRVLVVDAPEEEQVARAARRSNLGENEVRDIMAAQMPRAERLARADDVLTNDRGLAHLRRQVAQLHSKYLDLARGPGKAAGSHGPG